ncbi:MAG: aminoacyl-histidine dipeptidase [Clostridiales bacterium]|nr:aminoacyl-histidine dipeptidase [Clostridiales bacterium]
MGDITKLKPFDVFENFRIICSIPHGSGNTEQLSDYIVSQAEKLNCEYIRDESNNVIVFLDGTEGYKNAEPVILQGHIDMVCDKTDDSDCDMQNDSLTLLCDEKDIFADKTTLGGDDGIAVAYMLTIMKDSAIPHPPLELLFTSDEEIGMIGARALNADNLHTNRVINIDSEVEGVLTVSCAGGVRAVCSIPVKREKSDGQAYTVSITGLRGGHSGTEINTGRVNAIKLIGRMLNYLIQEADFKIAEIYGGKKYNAIPNEAFAKICVASDSVEVFLKAAEKFIHMIKTEKMINEPELCVALEKCELPDECFDCHSTQTALLTLLQVPDGVQTMSPDITNMVQTSLNMGILETKNDRISLYFLLRSNAAAGKQAIVQKLKSFIEYLNGNIEFMSDYPAWEYRADSTLRDIMIKVYAELYGEEPVVTAIHAGLECSILAGKLSNMDAVSFGPNIYHAHTPQERMEIASVDRCWEYLKAVLKNLKN